MRLDNIDRLTFDPVWLKITERTELLSESVDDVNALLLLLWSPLSVVSMALAECRRELMLRLICTENGDEPRTRDLRTADVWRWRKEQPFWCRGKKITIRRTSSPDHFGGNTGLTTRRVTNRASSSRARRSCVNKR